MNRCRSLVSSGSILLVLVTCRSVRAVDSALTPQPAVTAPEIDQQLKVIFEEKYGGSEKTPLSNISAALEADKVQQASGGIHLRLDLTNTGKNDVTIWNPLRVFLVYLSDKEGHPVYLPPVGGEMEVRSSDPRRIWLAYHLSALTLNGRRLARVEREQFYFHTPAGEHLTSDFIVQDTWQMTNTLSKFWIGKLTPIPAGEFRVHARLPLMDGPPNHNQRELTVELSPVRLTGEPAAVAAPLPLPFGNNYRDPQPDQP